MASKLLKHQRLANQSWTNQSAGPGVRWPSSSSLSTGPWRAERPTFMSARWQRATPNAKKPAVDSDDDGEGQPSVEHTGHTPPAPEVVGENTPAKSKRGGSKASPVWKIVKRLKAGHPALDEGHTHVCLFYVNGHDEPSRVSCATVR